MSIINNFSGVTSLSERITAKTGFSSKTSKQSASEDDVSLQSECTNRNEIYNKKMFQNSGPVFNSPSSTTVNTEDSIEDTINQRSADPEVRKAMMGALIYLDDMQIRDRPGKNSCQYDYSGGDGSKSTFLAKIPGSKSSVQIPALWTDVQNYEGEWASNIHSGKLFIGSEKGKMPFGMQDSNMFMTAFSAYPLYFFNEDSLSPGEQVVREIRKDAQENIKGFKRDEAYNFWREVPGDSGDTPRVTASNLSPKTLGKMSRFLIKEPWKSISKPFTKNIDPEMADWLDKVMNPEINPGGTDAFFNIPNDADDTSMAAALQKLHEKDYQPGLNDPYFSNQENFIVDKNALLMLQDYRDLDRTQASKMDAWKGENTGAYMTWLKDEDIDTFATPETGVIPGVVNLVDDVVNANAVFAFALNGLKDAEGYDDACSLVKKSADEKHWQQTGLYYPQRMIFPYCASRAFRDGGADDDTMKDAMQTLLRDVLEDRNAFLNENPDKKGAFPGGADMTTDLSTALGVTFLLNVGEETAKETGLVEEYREALHGGIEYLQKNGVAHKIKNDDTFNREGQKRTDDNSSGLKWEEGLFFAGDPQNMAQWCSEAYTTSMALEAFTKYTLAYDKDSNVNILEGRKINVEKYAGDVSDALEDFKFTVQ
jgi:hypothetical protein